MVASARPAAARLAAIGSLAALALLATGTAAPAAEADRALAAQQSVASTVESLAAILQDATSSAELRRDRIAEILERSLDVSFITRSALGRNADSLTREQTDELRQEMERYLVATWLQRVARTRVDRFEILGASWDEASGVAVVRTRGGRRIATSARNNRRQPAGEAAVDYQLHERRGAWLVRSMVIDGVDVVRLFRAQFDEILRTGDHAALMERLRSVNDRLESRNPLAARLQPSVPLQSA